MAFFKEYREAVRAKHEAERRAETERRQAERGYNAYIDNLRKGQRVSVPTAYNESGFLFFAGRISQGYVLLNDNKEEAQHGYGLIYHESIINR